MSSRSNSQQGPADLPKDTTALHRAVGETFVRGVGASAGGPAPQGRPHQVAAVTQLVTAVRQDCHRASATNYLLQHSAGSGKSLTIAALVAALLKTEDEAGRRFHTVLVVNDRLQLDQQLGDTVSKFLSGNGYPAGTVARANSSNQLRGFLLAPPDSPGRPAVILTTIQKLGSLWRNTDSAAWRRARKQSGQSKLSAAAAVGDQHADPVLLGDQNEPSLHQMHNAIAETLNPQNQTLADIQSDARSQLLGVLAQSRVAIIADEAHRHHGNSTSEQISAILAAAFGAGGSSIAGSSKSNSQGGKKRKQGQSAAGEKGGGAEGIQQPQQPRFVTYFGFTATPGPRALQLFGVAQQVEVDILGAVVPAADDGQQQSSVQAQQQQQQQGVNDLPQHDGAAEHQHQQNYLAPATLYTPAHCYSLQQATSDGFVLDVLQRFVSVTPRIQIAGLQLTEQQQQQLLRLDQASRLGLGSSSSTGKDLRSQLLGPRAAAAAAARAPAGGSNPGTGLPPLHNASGPSLAEELLVQAASNSRQLVAVKAEAVIDRFMQAWGEAVACGFVGFRAMLVVRSRQHVVWYVQELRRLLQQHKSQAAALLKQAGEAVDLDAAAAVAAGDMSPLCYGAYSGSVAVTAAEAQQLWDTIGSRDSYHLKTQTAATAATAFALNAAAAPVAPGTDAGTADTVAGRPPMTGKRKSSDTSIAIGGSNGVLRQRKSSGSSWDSALAAFDAQHAAQQQQQQEQDQLAASASPNKGKGSPGAPPAAVAAATAGKNSDQEDSSWFLKSGCPGTEQAEGSGSSSSEEDGGDAGQPPQAPSSSGSDSEYHQTASSSGVDSDSDIGSNEDQEVAEEAAAVPVERHKRVKRNNSTLSSSTANTAAAAAGDMDDLEVYSEDEQPLMARIPQQQRQQAPAATPAAAAMVVDDGVVVSVSERDLNPDGFAPGDARLLVVCSKFETGYDDPRLGAMFIDRSLSGARAVQVLGRINRPAPGKGLPLNTAIPDSVRDPGAEDSKAAVNTSNPDAAAVVVKQEGGEAVDATEALKPEQQTAQTAAAAAAPPAGASVGVGFNVLVVDFVNSVGTIKEAFSEFYGTTTYCTGSQAKRRRQQQAMDDSITRILEVLQPAAARQHTRQQLSRHQQNGSTAAANATSSGSSLASMNVSQMMQLVGVLPPDTQKAVEDDLSQYCSLCTKLRLEKLEFPYVFASALLNQLTARRQRRDKAASSGRFAWMESLHATAEAAAAAEQEEEEAQDAQPPADDDDERQQQQQGAADGDGSSKGPVTASRLQRKLNVSVRVCELETTFAGAVKLSASDQPLRSVKLTSHLSAAAKAASSAAAAASPDKQVRSGRPLHEVIAAANAQLAGKFKKQVVEGLRELCEKLKGAEGRLLAMERLREAQRAAAAVPAATVEVLRAAQQQQLHGTSAADDVRGAAAAAAPAGAEDDAAQQQQQQQEAAAAEGEDVYRILSLLRRLQLWPVTADLLKTTAAGKQVSALRNHPNPLVSNLATQIVQQWKTQLNAQQAAAAAKKAKEQQDKASGGSTAAGKAAQSVLSPAAAISQDLRRKVANMVKDAFMDHRQKVMIQQQQQQQLEEGRDGAAAGDDGSKQAAHPAGELSRLQHLAEVLEMELYQYVTNQGTANGGSAAAVASSSSSISTGKAGAAVQEYKSRARMLCTAIRYPDGLAPALIGGEKLASEVVGLDALSLAPAAVQEAIKKRKAEQRRAEEVWESLVQDSVGGGGTFVTNEVSCPSCGKHRAQVHNILSGGTYAQERVPIQKYVCQECLYTWKND